MKSTPPTAEAASEMGRCNCRQRGDVTVAQQAPAVEEARIHALAEKVKYVDATTWYQAGAYRSLWTLATSA